MVHSQVNFRTTFTDPNGSVLWLPLSRVNRPSVEGSTAPLHLSDERVTLNWVEYTDLYLSHICACVHVGHLFMLVIVVSLEEAGRGSCKICQNAPFSLCEDLVECSVGSGIHKTSSSTQQTGCLPLSPAQLHACSHLKAS